MQRLIKAFQNSLAGLRAAFANEAAFRQECLLALVLIPLAFVVKTGAIEKTLLIGSVLLVFIVEIVNSAIEAVVDRIGPELHELSGRAKDLGSAAVLLALLGAAMTWGIILLG